MEKKCKVCAKYIRKMSDSEEKKNGKNFRWTNVESYPPEKTEKTGINASYPPSYPHYPQCTLWTEIVERFVKIKHAFCLFLIYFQNHLIFIFRENELI